MIWNRTDVIDLISQAGKLALSYTEFQSELKSDLSIVTDADKAVEQFLLQALEDEPAGIRFIGEETLATRSHEYLGMAVKGKSWIVDPIDGTAEFAHHVPIWGISIGWAEDGMIREGAVLIPETGELMISDHGKSFYSHRPRLKPEEWDFKNHLIELTKPDVPVDVSGIVALSQKVCRHSDIHVLNPINAFCCTVYPMILLATGRCLSMVSHAKLWDFAGSLPSLRNLGFHGRLTNGEDLLSLKISPEIYHSDLDEKPFLIRDLAVFASSNEADEYVRKGFLNQ